MQKLKPWQVWLKQDGSFSGCILGTHNPVEAWDYARNKIVHGNNVEWIEIRDLIGPLETIWRRSWHD